MRYRKGDYDEDCARDLDLRGNDLRGNELRRGDLRDHDRRCAHRVPGNDEDSDMRVFQVLVAIQIFMFILAGLLFVSSR